MDNDPSLDYCDNCEHPLRDSTTAVISPRQPVPVPRPRPVPTVEFIDDGDDEEETRVHGGIPRQPAEPRPLTRPLLAAVAVLTLAGAVGGTVLALNRDEPEPGPEPIVTVTTSAFTEPALPLTAEPTIGPPSPTADRAAQGAALDELLDRSKRSRDKLVQANDAVFRCAGLAGAIRRLRDVGTERNQERATLAGLDLSALANGEELRSALDSALSHSLTADGYYVKWAQEKQRNGCRETAVAEAHRIDGDNESKIAGTAKKRFLDSWNPVAAQLGLPLRDRDGI
ncbi:hypothetical protein Ate01nite_46460 [Actinoplanes teichomyceticus]|nr:hypothetical protein Ate01nite_46460 [Actinoplanes teichomyceticus]